MGFKLNPQTSNLDTDSESVMSCQLITSASLLLNRDSVREATHEVKQNEARKINVPPLHNPRQFVNTQSTQTSILQQQQHQQQLQAAKQQHHQFKQQANYDALKPPPMETQI